MESRTTLNTYTTVEVQLKSTNGGLDGKDDWRAKNSSPLDARAAVLGHGANLMSLLPVLIAQTHLHLLANIKDPCRCSTV